jgi:hypothetical protein
MSAAASYGATVVIMPFTFKRAPISVLHEAMTLAGIADRGPMLPQLSSIAAEQRTAVGAASRSLLAHDRTLP